MKINELIKQFEIFITNEEQNLLGNIDSPTPLNSFNEREQFIIANLIRKSLITKVNNHGNVLVIKNEQKFN